MTDYVVIGAAARGLIKCDDGILLDVTPNVVEVESPDRAVEVAHHIAVQHEQAGTFGSDWKHADCAHCGGQ